MTTHSKHYPQWWKIESISSKVRNKTRVPIFTITIQHSFGRFGHSNQSRRRNKRNPNWKRRSKALTICRWHDPLHKNPKDSTRKLLELINGYSKVQDIQSTHRNPLHSYALTMRKQKEKLRKQLHLPLQWKE